MSTATPTTRTLGSNIRRIREEAEISQLALAHKMGWRGSNAGAQISRFENGSKEPRFSTLERIAKALGVSVGVLTKQPGGK